jgi:hypothetical protein
MRGNGIEDDWEWWEEVVGGLETTGGNFRNKKVRYS